MIERETVEICTSHSIEATDIRTTPNFLIRPSIDVGPVLQPSQPGLVPRLYGSCIDSFVHFVRKFDALLRYAMMAYFIAGLVHVGGDDGVDISIPRNAVVFVVGAISAPESACARSNFASVVYSVQINGVREGPATHHFGVALVQSELLVIVLQVRYIQ